MKRVVTKKYVIFFTITLMASFCVSAQSGGIFEITHATIESGGSTSSGGVFELTGSIGQFEVNGVADTGQFELTGGFWVSGSDLIFKDGFE